MDFIYVLVRKNKYVCRKTYRHCGFSKRQKVYSQGRASQNLFHYQQEANGPIAQLNNRSHIILFRKVLI